MLGVESLVRSLNETLNRLEEVYFCGPTWATRPVPPTPTTTIWDRWGFSRQTGRWPGVGTKETLGFLIAGDMNEALKRGNIKWIREELVAIKKMGLSDEVEHLLAFHMF